MRLQLRSKPRFLVLKSLMNTGIGRSDRIRTCGIDVPKVGFYLVFVTFKQFLVVFIPEKSRFLCSLTLSCALSPFAPKPSMVSSVVRNTSRGIVHDARPREVVCIVA